MRSGQGDAHAAYCFHCESHCRLVNGSDPRRNAGANSPAGHGCSDGIHRRHRALCGEILGAGFRSQMRKRLALVSCVGPLRRHCRAATNQLLAQLIISPSFGLPPERNSDEILCSRRACGRYRSFPCRLLHAPGQSARRRRDWRSWRRGDRRSCLRRKSGRDSCRRRNWRCERRSGGRADRSSSLAVLLLRSRRRRVRRPALTSTVGA